MTEKSPLILLVDDDVDFVEITRLALTSHGYRTVCSYDPVDAMDKALAEKPDLIISDLVMGSLDAGFAFARQVKQHAELRGVPLILATSASSQYGFNFQPENKAELGEMNVEAYFDKPIPTERLLETIRQLLGPEKKETPS